MAGAEWLVMRGGNRRSVGLLLLLALLWVPSSLSAADMCEQTEALLTECAMHLEATTRELENEQRLRRAALILLAEERSFNATLMSRIAERDHRLSETASSFAAYESEVEAERVTTRRRLFAWKAGTIALAVLSAWLMVR